MYRVILLVLGLFVMSGQALAAAPTVAFTIKCRPNGALAASIEDGKPVLSIRGDGIGRATLTRDGKEWPREIKLRIYLKGLESLVINNGPLKWSASVRSHGDFLASENWWQDGKEGPALKKDSPHWADIARFGPDGKAVAGLPPAGGWFELKIPAALLGDGNELKLAWIDFYR